MSIPYSTWNYKSGSGNLRNSQGYARHGTFSRPHRLKRQKQSRTKRGAKTYAENPIPPHPCRDARLPYPCGLRVCAIEHTGHRHSLRGVKGNGRAWCRFKIQCGQHARNPCSGRQRAADRRAGRRIFAGCERFFDRAVPQIPYKREESRALPLLRLYAPGSARKRCDRRNRRRAVCRAWL